MRSLPVACLFASTLFAVSCARTSSPGLSPITDAPECVRAGVEVCGIDGRMVIDYSLSLHTTGERWTPLPLSIRDNKLYTRAIFFHNELDPAREIELLIDTGSNEFLGLLPGHPAVSQVWISEEHGSSDGHTLIGTRPAWRGAGCGLVIGGVFLVPAPVTVVDARFAGDHAWLGHSWFNLSNAVWLDVAGEALAVSHSEGAAQAVIDASPSLWLEIPWDSVGADGHRFVPLNLGGHLFDAVIDTGSQMELFVNAKPEFPVIRPSRFRLHAWGRQSPGYSSRCDVPVALGSHRIEVEQVSWPQRPTGVGTTTSQRPLALLGVPFLRRYPVLLDYENDRVVIFVGDRMRLRSPVDLNTR